MCGLRRVERNCQTYVEDCQVCCKPNVLRVTWDKSAGEYAISAELE